MHKNTLEARKRFSMKVKKCTRCKEDRPIDKFYKHALTRAAMCHDCRREYNKERYVKQKKLLQQY